MKISVDSIIVRERVRHELGDLSALMESMQKHGQLNPITITRNNELIAGHRRLLAARTLSWQHIDATIVDRDSEIDKLTMELEENVHRKDFSPQELLAGYKRLDKLQRPRFFRRVGGMFKGFFARLFHRQPDPSMAIPTTDATADTSTSAASTDHKAPTAAAPAKSTTDDIGQYGV